MTTTSILLFSSVIVLSQAPRKLAREACHRREIASMHLFYYEPTLLNQDLRYAKGPEQFT
eukprot:2521157-Amphidinium_carterae.1